MFRNVLKFLTSTVNTVNRFKTVFFGFLTEV